MQCTVYESRASGIHGCEAEEFGQMPIMYGIAAYVVLANGLDQGGIDPQIDKQYAIVKKGIEVKPAVAPEDEGVSASRPAIDRGNPQGRAGVLATTQGSAVGAGQGTTTDTQQTISIGGQIVNVGAAPAGAITVEMGGKIVQLPSNLNVASPFGQSGSRSEGLYGRAMFSGDSLSKLKGMDRTVSIQFNNASAVEVLKWLSKQNVNFVANVDKLPKTKITMNVSNVPLHEALSAVAESLGGSWQVRGTTLIFQTGMFHTLPYKTGQLGSLSGFGEMKELGDLKAFALSNEKGLKLFSQAQAGGLKAFDQAHTMNLKAFEEFKSLRGLNKDGKAFEFKTIDPKAFEELKSLHGLTKTGPGVNLKAFTNMKSFGELKGFHGMTFKKVDSEKFMKSLTSSQKDLMKKQGYLKFSDLTEAQRAMLFEGSTKELPKDFTFMFSLNGEKIVIKN